jgi:hypothetical protein
MQHYHIAEGLINKRLILSLLGTDILVALLSDFSVFFPCK